ncbi:MAG TPA: SCO2322 family protein [Nocardioidaceae bacterium]|nr:SCO2322 family protein [Nocardioidaceae bacterium]
MRRSPIRSRTLALIGAVLVSGLGAAFPLASPASAAPTESAPAYKYWGYYHADGDGDDWKYSTVGATEATPNDGTVEGWRYGLDTDGSRTPRVMPDFASICGGQTTSADHKLVAVVIDYGLPEEAEGDDETPDARGACADVPADATGQDVLQSVAETTTGDAGIASIDGYPSVPTTDTFGSADIPASEPPVGIALPTHTPDQQTSDAADDDSDDGAPWALIGIGVLVVVIAGGAVAVARRRS